MDKIDPCSSGWLKSADGILKPLWFEGDQVPGEMKKGKLRDSAKHQTNTDDSTDSHPRTTSSPVACIALEEDSAKDQTNTDESTASRPRRTSSLVACIALEEMRSYDDECRNDSDDSSSDKSEGFETESDSDDADV